MNKKFDEKRITSFILLLVFSINLFVMVEAIKVNKNEEAEEKITCELQEVVNVVPDDSSSETETLEQEKKEQEVVENKRWTDTEMCLLAKIAMAEAEGESLETKVLIILTVLNRVKSNNFPNTIEEVIFQNTNGVFQFSPVKPGGRWWTTEPNEECWKAVDIVSKLDYDFSNGALFFEACKNESWHSRNLEFICQRDNTRFYK